VTPLPSTSNTTSQQLVRHIWQEINHVVNQSFAAHSDTELMLEALSISAMRFKSCRMNARVKASNIG
jgi:hypothetical protein